nr:hypothetical protein [Tanacetum cinerariifolium]
MNQLKVDTLTPELLVSPTFELMKGLCKILVELDYFLEEVYKATTDQLDWNNPEDRQYPHDLRQPLPLIPNSQRCRVIPFDHFINNDLAYINVTQAELMQLQDDDKPYTFKEGDYKRLRLQDIEDMLLLIVQGKLTNLTNEERLALNVSLRMFTRSVVIQSIPNPRGFIYHNKDKKNKLLYIDELYKFSDDTLNDVRTALNDTLKRIRIKYLPQTFWRNVDKERAGALI